MREWTLRLFSFICIFLLNRSTFFGASAKYFIILFMDFIFPGVSYSSVDLYKTFTAASIFGLVWMSRANFCIIVLTSSKESYLYSALIFFDVILLFRETVVTLFGNVFGSENHQDERWVFFGFRFNGLRHFLVKF